MKSQIFSLITKVGMASPYGTDQLLTFMKCCIQRSVPYSLDEAYNEKIMLVITLLAPWPGSRLDEKSNVLFD